MSELPFQFISLIIAVNIPLLFVTIIIDDIDSRRIMLCFAWGLFAGALAFAVNTLLGGTWEQDQRMSLSIAPIIEEVCKGLPLLFFLNEKKHPQITKVIIYCAMVSGIGFSVQESLYYFAISSREAGDVARLVVRSLTTALMHGMTTAAIGVGLKLLHRHRHIIVLIVFTLFALSASLHALFNLLLQTPFSLLAILMPMAMFAGGMMLVREL